MVEQRLTAEGDKQGRAAARLRNALFLTLLFILALLLWVNQADSRGVWQDEGLTLYQARLPFSDILANRIPVAQFNTRNTVPPFYFLLLGGWGRLVGYELWTLRLFSMFCGIVTLALLYRVGAWMGGTRAGRVSALLGAISPLHLWYAQEMRMYTLLLVPSALSFGLLWKWYRSRERGRRAWPLALAYALTAALLGWTHYLAFLLVAAQMVWLALAMLRQRPLALLATMGVVGLLTIPLVPFALERLTVGAERDFFYRSLPYIAQDLLHSFSFGLPLFTSRWEEVRLLLPVVAGLLVGGLWVSWKRGGWPLMTLLAAGLVLPVLLIYAVSFVKPVYQNARHLIFIGPPFYWLMALALSWLAARHRWLGVLLVALLALGWLPAMNRYFNDPYPQKNDVSGLFSYLREQYVPGDVVALNDPVLQHAFEYFAPGIPWVILPPYAQPQENAEPAYEAVARQYERVWYVYGPPDTTFDTWEHVYYWFDGRYPRLGFIDFPGQTRIGAAHFDTQGPTIQDVPHEAAVPADVRLDESIRFRGLYDPLEPTPAGSRIVIETLWAVDAQPATDWQLQLQLRDGADRLWYQQQVEPFGGLHRTNHWQAGQQLRMPVFLSLPSLLPPATYTLRLAFVAPDGRSLPAPGSEPLVAGNVVIERPERPEAIEGTSLGDSLRVGTTTPSEEPLFPQRVAEASTLPLALPVTVVDDGALPDTFTISLRGTEPESTWSHRVTFDEGLPASSDGSAQLPPGGMQKGDSVFLRYALELPSGLSGTFDMQLEAFSGAVPLAARGWWGLRSEPTITLGSVTIDPRPRRTEAPALANPVMVEWPGAARLLGYNVTTQPTSSGAPPLNLQLAWQTVAPTDRPYKVFLHAVDEQGLFVAGADALFEVPSEVWEDGEIVLSNHTFAAGSLPPGRYTLLVGLYHEASQERFVIDAPNQAFPFGAVEISE